MIASRLKIWLRCRLMIDRPRFDAMQARLQAMADAAHAAAAGRAICAGPHRWDLIALTAYERTYECRVGGERWKSFVAVHVDADGFEARMWATPPR